jgi:hypothetical protein
MPAGLDFRPHFRGTSGGEQADRLGVRQRQVKGCYPPAGMLPLFRVRVPVELRGVPHEDRPADPLHRRHPDLPAGGQDRLEVAAWPLAGGQLPDLDPTGGGEFPQGRLQRAGGKLRAGSLRQTGATRCSPVTGSWPANNRWTASSLAIASRPERSARLPAHQPGDSPLPA